MVKEFIEKNKEAMIEDLAKLVKYNSVYSEDMPPFGKENRLVLDEALNLMASYGLKTTNLDYYCGFGEVGKGDEVIGILAHLDVVPAGDGWNSDPFSLTRVDETLYGRGVTDDKGAVIASLYALKYLIETNYDFKKRVRLIVGCNEESGSECIKHYVQKEGHIDMGFTPDGNFPGIYGEKGMLYGMIKGKSDKIVSIKGGTVSNVVCKDVSCSLIKDSFNLNTLLAYFKDNDLKCEVSEDDNLVNLKITGKAAHASMPDLGINAINHLFYGLYLSGMEDNLVNYFYENIKLDNHGSLFGCDKLRDEYSDLSFNLGLISKEDDEIRVVIDMRFPVTRSVKEVSEVILKGLNKDGVICEVFSGHEPLFFDKNTPMIKALKKAYDDIVGDEEEMEVIGGGTYAKAINNCIAFGCEFKGEDCHIHDANESLKLASFYKQVEIYIEAIKNLCEV